MNMYIENLKALSIGGYYIYTMNISIYIYIHSILRKDI